MVLGVALRSARLRDALPGRVVVEAPAGELPTMRANANGLARLLGQATEGPAPEIILVEGEGAGADPDLAAYRAAEAEPLVKDLLKRFDGDIVARQRVMDADWRRQADGG